MSVTRPHSDFCTNNAASKSIILSCIIFLYEKLKNYSIGSFKECLFFVFCLFYFLLLPNNTLHVMFYICYWNTFQFKYIIQITFYVVKQSHSRVTSKDICLVFIILFLCLFSFCLDFALLRFISFSLPSFYCHNFSFVCFHGKITWHLSKVNKKVKTERISSWIDAQSSCLVFKSFNVPPCLQAFFYKQHFYKQRHTEIGKKLSKS